MSRYPQPFKKEISDSERDQARLWYLYDWMPTQEIADKLGCSYSTVAGWIGSRKGWREEREHLVNEFLRETRQRHANKLGNCIGLGVDLIEQALKARKEKLGEDGKPVPLSMREAATVSEILTQFDKILRLEYGKPTEITTAQASPVTIEQLREYIVQDPFLRLAERANPPPLLPEPKVEE